MKFYDNPNKDMIEVRCVGTGKLLGFTEIETSYKIKHGLSKWINKVKKSSPFLRCGIYGKASNCYAIWLGGELDRSDREILFRWSGSSLRIDENTWNDLMAILKKA